MAHSRLLRAWLYTGISDFLFACVLSIVFYHSTFARLWQGVASVLFGPDALTGGSKFVAIGIVMHFVTAFTWSAVFYFLVGRIGFVQRLLVSPFGVLKVASFYGPFIWACMSLVVIPTLTHRAPGIPNVTRWIIQALGHIAFVATPMLTAFAGKDSVVARST